VRTIIKNAIFSLMAFAFIFGLFAVVFSAFLPVLAQENGVQTRAEYKVEISDVKITPKGDRVGISATLFNPSSRVETAPFTHLILLNTIDPLIKPTKDPELSPSPLIVFAIEGSEADYFSLKPLEEKEVSYFLPVAASLPAGNYSLYLRMIEPNGNIVGSYDDVVYNFGANKKNKNLWQKSFLAFDQESCAVVGSNGKIYGNNDGPVFNPGESPKIRCAVKNIGNEAVEVFPNMEWKEFYVYGKPSVGKKQTEKSGKAITFKPGETKLIELSLPSAEKPQVYQVLLSFADNNGEIKSFNMFFRWTVGGASARIDSAEMASPLKSVYKKGDVLSFSVGYYGSADLFWSGTRENVSELNDVKIKIKVKDSKGEICGQAEALAEDIKGADLKSQTVEVALDKKCENISYSASLVSGEEKLANEESVLPKLAKKIDYGYFIGGGLLLALILVLAMVIIKRKKKLIGGVGISALLLFAFVLAGINAVSARTETGSSSSGGNYGGGWSGNSDTLYSYWGGNDSANMNKFRIKKEKSGSAADKGYSIYADFNDYFNNGGQAKIYTNYMADDGACANSSMVVKIKISISADGLGERYVGFAKGGSSDYQKSWTREYNKSSASVIDRDFNINPDALADFYEDDGNGGKKLRGNPVLFVEFRQAGKDSHKNNYYKAGFSSNINKTPYTDRSKAMDDGAVIRIKIPLNLPDPKIDNFSANENPVDYNCKPTLNWTVSDVGSCSASGGWSGSKSVSSGAHSETLSAITEDTDYTLQCSKNLGGSGSASRSKTITVNVNDAPTVTSFVADKTSVKQGDEVKLTWASNNASYCVGYTVDETNGWNGSNQRGSSGSNKVTPYAGNKTYELICYNSCGGASGKSSLTISVGTGDSSSSSSSISGGVTCPDGYCSASESCSTCSADCGSCFFGSSSSNSSQTIAPPAGSSSSSSSSDTSGPPTGGYTPTGGNNITGGLPSDYDGDETKTTAGITIKEDEDGDSGTINASTDYAVIVAKIIDGLDATSKEATINFSAEGLGNSADSAENFNGDISISVSEPVGSYILSPQTVGVSGNSVSPPSAKFSVSVDGSTEADTYVFDIEASGEITKEHGEWVPPTTVPKLSNSSLGSSSCVPKDGYWKSISKTVSASTKVVLKVKRIATHFEEF